MSQMHKKRVLVLLGIVVAVALLFPVLFGAAPTTTVRVGEDSWRSFVYDFQTLITGVLAIAAAYFTVRSGQRIDERQQLRHEQIYDLQIRPDRLRLARAKQQFNKIKHYGDTIFEWDFPDLGNLNPSLMSRDADVMIRIATAAQRMHAHLMSEEMSNIRDMLDGPLNTNFDDFKRRLRTLGDRARTTCEIDGREVQIEDRTGGIRYVGMTPAIRQEVYMSAFRDFAHAGMLFRDFSEGFQSMARQYKVL